MRYMVKQRIFSLADKFVIKDENENDVLIVAGKVFSIGNKLRIFDLNENEVCYIEQQVFKLMPEYNIYVEDQLVATVKKKFSLLKNDFVITSNRAEYYVDGKFLAHEFKIFSNEKLVGEVSKKYFSLTDTYGVEVDDDEDQVTILALAIVIDMACHNQNS